MLDAELDEMVETVETLIDEFRLGKPFDFETLDPDIWTLCIFWDKTERQIANIRSTRVQTFLKGIKLS